MATIGGVYGGGGGGVAASAAAAAAAAVRAAMAKQLEGGGGMGGVPAGMTKEEAREVFTNPTSNFTLRFSVDLCFSTLFVTSKPLQFHLNLHINLQFRGPGNGELQPSFATSFILKLDKAKAKLISQS